MIDRFQSHKDSAQHDCVSRMFEDAKCLEGHFQIIMPSKQNSLSRIAHDTPCDESHRCLSQFVAARFQANHVPLHCIETARRWPVCSLKHIDCTAGGDGSGAQAVELKCMFAMDCRGRQCRGKIEVQDTRRINKSVISIKSTT